MDTLLHDLKYGLRMLARRPGFTAVAVITLALGIGANTTLFSIINGVLLKPLPYRDAERLSIASVSVPDYKDFRAQATSFDATAIWASNLYNVRVGEESMQTAGILANPEFFEILGTAHLGRTFVRGEDDRLLVVVGYNFWQRRLGGDRSVLGRSLVLSGRPHTIIGVMGPEFQFPSASYELWVPFGSAMAMAPAQAQNRLLRIFRMVAHLKPGVSGSQAQAEAETISKRLQQQYPDSNKNFTIRLTPLYERIVGDVRPALLILMGTVGFVLLIACANVANLTLSRTIERQREIVIRSALGAGRGRVVRQLLTESVILSLAGGAAGLLLAKWAMEALPALRGIDIPRAVSIRLDPPVLLFTLCVSVLTGVLFGLLPAIEAARVDLNHGLTGGTRTAGTRRGQRLRGGLMAAEIALAFVVVVGAALLIQSFARLLRVDAGFVAEKLVTTNIQFVRYKDPRQRAAASQAVLDAIERIPGVESVGAATGLPPQTAQRSTRFEILGREPDPQMNSAYFIAVSPNYFRTLGTPLIAGRHFDPRDNNSGRKVVMISRSMARRLFPNDDAVGRELRLVNPEETAEWRTIVGVVADIRYSGLDDPNQSAIFTPFAQTPFFWNYVMVRTRTDSQRIESALRQAVASADPSLEMAPVRAMDDIVAESVARPRFNTVLLSSFAMLAFVLAVVGIYGVVSYGVTQQTREIGVRMALGAGRSEVMRFVLTHGLRYALIGVILGAGVALATMRVLSRLLFEIKTTDAATFCGVAVLLCIVSTLACVLPARRALRIDPMTALRYN